MDTTLQQVIWQYFDAHAEEFMEYLATKTQDASSVEVVSYDPDRHLGLLTSFVWQGVRKVVNVTPQSLVEGLGQLNEDIRRRCTEAAGAAETAADRANTAAGRVETAIENAEDATNDANDAAALANEKAGLAQGIYSTVNTWYSTFHDTAETWFSSFKSTAESWWITFKPAAESWYSAFKQTCETWWATFKPETEEWIAARKAEWRAFYTEGAVPEWASLKGDVTGATDAANDAAALAERKGNVAEAQGDVAELQGDYAKGEGDYAKAQGDYGKTQGDYAKNMANHPAYIADGSTEKPGDLNYWYIWNYATQQYVRDTYAKGDDLHWGEMSNDEKENLAQVVMSQVAFASEAECRQAVHELNNQTELNG